MDPDLPVNPWPSEGATVYSSPCQLIDWIGLVKIFPCSSNTMGIQGKLFTALVVLISIASLGLGCNEDEFQCDNGPGLHHQKLEMQWKKWLPWQEWRESRVAIQLDFSPKMHTSFSTKTEMRWCFRRVHVYSSKIKITQACCMLVNKALQPAWVILKYTGAA